MLAGKPGKRVLITGATGFVGSHMADLLATTTDDLFATRRWHHSSMLNIQKSTLDRITWIDCDLTDPIATRVMMDKADPDEIYHFAAESFVSPSWGHPTQYMRNNYDATVNLLESARRNPDIRILIPGSGEEYGEVPESDLPITPSTPLRPVNPYAVTKIAQDLISYVYFKSYGTKVIRIRAFNHEGPRRPNVFGISWYAYQVAQIEAGKQDPVMKVGWIDDVRNFTHVYDMVEAYRLAMSYCLPGKLYLIGTDDVHTFRDAVERLIAMSTVKGILYTQVPEFTRPTQVPRLIAYGKPFAELTGWKPRYTFDDILRDMLLYWRTI